MLVPIIDRRTSRKQKHLSIITPERIKVNFSIGFHLPTVFDTVRYDVCSGCISVSLFVIKGVGGYPLDTEGG